MQFIELVPVLSSELRDLYFANDTSQLTYSEFKDCNFVPTGNSNVT